MSFIQNKDRVPKTMANYPLSVDKGGVPTGWVSDWGRVAAGG